jgi:hypothetical protein
MNFWVLNWLRAFALTVVIELAVAFPFLSRLEGRKGRRLGGVLLVNLATHPLVWFLFPGLAMSYALRDGLAESWAVAGETIGYLVIWPALGLRRAAVLALIANGTSYALGLTFRFAGWL